MSLANFIISYITPSDVGDAYKENFRRGFSHVGKSVKQKVISNISLKDTAKMQVNIIVYKMIIVQSLC